MKNKLLEWKLRSKTNAFKRLVDDAKRHIERALQTTRFIVSWSSGKDSTAMTHFVRGIAPDTPIMIQFDDCDWPEKAPYVDRVCKALGWTMHKVMPPFSVWDMVSKLKIGQEDFCSQDHAVTREGFLKPLNAKRRELGCIGVFLGLRMDEGHARKLNLATRGPLYQLTDGTWRCSPLWRWEAADIFAYHVANDIEINPCYFQNRFLPPEEIRLAWALPTPAGLAKGTMEHIRYYYPAQFRRLRDLGIV